MSNISLSCWCSSVVGGLDTENNALDASALDAGTATKPGALRLTPFVVSPTAVTGHGGPAELTPFYRIVDFDSGIQF